MAARIESPSSTASSSADRRAGRSARLIALVAASGLAVLGVLLALAATGRLAGLLPCGSAGAAPCQRILFIGNSYTAVNDLPTLFRRLGEAGGHRVETAAIDPGGATLADHAASPGTSSFISGSPWTFVVIQEQSEIPADDRARQQLMVPSARSLVAAIRDRAALPVFFSTWAHRDGSPERGLDYGSMQARIDTAYGALGAELGVRVAPVGDAWLALRRQDPDLALWQADGSHPTLAGSYLAGCVFYAIAFSQSPEGLTETAGLPSATARELQQVAWVAATAMP